MIAIKIKCVLVKIISDKLMSDSPTSYPYSVSADAIYG